tara:strand:+ start:220 stop:861 length:642 start_codon:yes stop_codon:yes gene_type:complete
MEKIFIESIVYIQSTLNAPKGQQNTFGKYKYRSCEDILTAVKPLLARKGLIQTITDSIELVGDRYYVKATITVTDGVSTVTSSAYAREQQAKYNKDGKETTDHAQITGATSSYARKYALNGMWCIDDTKDADTDEFRRSETAKAQGVIVQKTKEYITNNQEEEIEELLLDSKSDVAKFLQHMRVSKISEIETSKYDSVIKMLDMKLKRLSDDQ